MPLNIPDIQLPRIVIVGAGFGGFQLARSLPSSSFQTVLIDRHNFHQFQPLYYQVAMAGLEPSSICFPLRRSFQKKKNCFVRVAEVEGIDPVGRQVITDQGAIRYDFLVLAMGARTNYFNRTDIEQAVIPMKSISESLYLRNRILEDLEKAVVAPRDSDLSPFLDIAIVGGGPTGVELAGALAEMKKHILPKDYPDLDSSRMHIHLIEGKDRLLAAMSPESSARTLADLRSMGVEVHLSSQVRSMDGNQVLLGDGSSIRAGKVIWAAGITGALVQGIPGEAIAPGGRIRVDEFCRVQGLENVFAIGDIARMETEEHPNGHPQMAPAAMQQARWLASWLRSATDKPFRFTDKGQMATIGRHKAVTEFAGMRMAGFPAWAIWLLVHIYYLIGVRNRLIVLINWIWSYLFYDQNLRLIIKPRVPPADQGQ